MIRSMTGFGKGQAKIKYGQFGCEIRTVNHRFCEISIKVPNGMVKFEDRLRAYLQSHIKRGKVYFNLILEDNKAKGEGLVVDRKLAAAYYRELKRLKEDLKLSGEVPLEQLIAFPNVVTFEGKEYSLADIWPAIKQVTDQALGGLIKDREAEGGRLAKDMLKRAKRIEKVLGEINERSVVNVENYKKRLGARVKELSGGHEMDKGRLEQEVALFAKNCDVHEEIVRIKSHLVNFRKALALSAEVGKKLDFVSQELQREINTVGSKASDFKIASGVIQIKSEIEKIREQLKNIE